MGEGRLALLGGADQRVLPYMALLGIVHLVAGESRPSCYN